MKKSEDYKPAMVCWKARHFRRDNIMPIEQQIQTMVDNFFYYYKISIFYHMKQSIFIIFY